jgi:hypothetical protein
MAHPVLATIDSRIHLVSFATRDQVIEKVQTGRLTGNDLFTLESYLHPERPIDLSTIEYTGRTQPFESRLESIGVNFDITPGNRIFAATNLWRGYKSIFDEAQKRAEEEKLLVLLRGAHTKRQRPEGYLVRLNSQIQLYNAVPQTVNNS